MPKDVHPFVELLRNDTRYKPEAYQFVRESLVYAQEALGYGKTDAENPPPEGERHLTGQELCEALRVYALEQFGMMSLLVLHRWGIRSTSDIGSIVYNLIAAGLMKKSDSDRRQDFDNVYDFDNAFRATSQLFRSPSSVDK